MLGRDDGALDDEDVEAGLERVLVVLATRCGVSEAAQTTPCSLISRDALRHQLAVERRLVDAPASRRSRPPWRSVGDPLELLLRVLVAGEDALEVEDAEAAELADDAGGRRRDDAVHGRRRAAGARTGTGPSVQLMSMSSGSRVRRDGTIAMSSKP